MKALFMSNESSKIELLIPTDSELRIQHRKKGNHIHHLTIEVESFDLVIENYKKAGYSFIDEKSDRSFENRRIAFIEQLTTRGVLIEILEGRL